MNVRAVMNPNVKCAGPQASLADVATIMEKNDCGAVPILSEEKKLIGMITDRDICLGLARFPRPASEVRVTELMSKKVFYCGPNDEIAEALQTMQGKRVRRLPVIDSNGKLVGILSMDDVVLHTELKKTQKSSELDSSQTVNTLKAIYKRPGAKKELIARP